MFVRSRRIGCHLLGMIKMSKTKYDTTDGVMTANANAVRRAFEALQPAAQITCETELHNSAQ